jgi:cytochrome c-type biogenesis protein CcmH
VDGTSDDRLFALAAQLKCEQCIGESVAGSSAQFAVAARGEIERQMRLGKSDDEILASFVEPYGEDVLLNPPNSGLASLVWILPPLVAGLAILGVGSAIRTWVRRPAGEIDVSFEDADLVRAALEARAAPAGGAVTSPAEAPESEPAAKADSAEVGSVEVGTSVVESGEVGSAGAGSVEVERER